MPIYEYRCGACATTFEVLRSLDDADEPATCPAGHDGANRVPSLVAPPTRDEVPGAADTACCAGGCACGA